MAIFVTRGNITILAQENRAVQIHEVGRFAGNLLAGWLGTFWSTLSQPAFFMLIALTAAVSAFLLLAFIRPARAAEQDLGAERGRSRAEIQ